MIKGLLISLLSCAALLAAGQDKRITLEFNNESLIDVLTQMEEEYERKLSYSSDAIPVNERVSLQLKDATIFEALDNLSKLAPLTYKVVNGMIVLVYQELTQTVRGIVTDQSTQFPIIGATVTILDSDPVLGAATDANGQFKINNVPVGRRSIKVTYIGYEERIIRNVLIGTGKEVVLNVEILESVTQMEELIIQDEGVASLPVNDMAIVSARSFTVEETKRFPVGLGDPLRLASSFAGVVAQDDVNNEIVIRGNTPRGILWKLDGVEIPSPNHFSSEGTSSGGVSMFSTQVISRSDFFTGAFAPEYGNATAGVFDIHLRNGNNERTENTVQAGLLGLDLSAEGPFSSGKSSYLFNYRYSTLSILDAIGLDVIDDSETTTFQDFSFKLNFPTKTLGTFSVFGLGGKSSVENNFFPEYGVESYDMGVVGLSNQLNLDSKSFIRTTVSASGTRIIDDFFREGNRPFTERQNFTKSYKRAFVLLNRKFNARHTLEAGFTYSLLDFDFISSVQSPLSPPPYDSYNSFDESGNTQSKQGYVSWKFRASNRLSFVNGFHWLHFNLNGESSWEPRSSLRWQVADDKSISLGFGMHSRIESLEYYFGNDIADNGIKLQHNRNLGLTKSNHFVVGYEKAFNEKTYFRTEVYYQYLYNVPVFFDSLLNSFSTLNLTDGYTPEQLINEGSGRNYGIEFTMERTFANSYYYLMNLSIYESKYKTRNGIEWDTRFNGNAASNFLFGKEFNVGRNNRNNILGVNIKMAYAGNKRYTPISVQASRQFGREIRPINNTYKLKYPDYSRTDLQISFRRNTRRTTSEWRLDIQNLFGKENVLYDFYSIPGQQVVQEKGTGIIPVLSYRLEF